MSYIDDATYKSMKKALDSAPVAEPTSAYPIEADENAILTFAAWGDPQISSISPLRAARFTAACKDVANMSGKLDAVVLLGDVAEFGRECEYKVAADILNSISDKFDSFFAVSGNHDIRLRSYHTQVKKFNDFIRSVKGGVAGSDKRYYFTHDIKGCRFIMMGSDAASFEGTYLSRGQLLVLDRDITEAEKKGMPVFVFNHQTLRNSNGLPETWLGKGSWRGSVGIESDKLRRVFEKHNNVIFITGHLHYGVSKYNFEDCGCFKMLSLPTVGVVNHGANDAESQGYIISVYNDRIEMRARSHAQGRYFDESMAGAKITIKR